MITNILTEHKYKIIVLLTLVLISIIILLILLGKTPFNHQPDFPGAKGEPIEYDLEEVPTPTPDESHIGDTGYMEEEFSQQELNEIDQITKLREQSPYDGLDFIVDYNYQTFQFDVVIYEPYTSAEEAFRSWKRVNYPGIPDEKFVIIRQ